MTAGPLDGIVVIDLTRVLAGPFCTLLLQDLGARVIKVELPERGDEARGFGPFLHGVSGYFASVNRGKESIALDLKAEPDRAVLERLIARGDVLVENFRPGVMERLGFGREGPARDQPAPHPPRGVGLRPDRAPMPGERALRPRGAGDGRPDEPDRPGPAERRPASAPRSAI